MSRMAGNKDCEKEKTPPPVANEDLEEDAVHERDSIDSLLTESSSSDSGRAAERSPPRPGHKRGRKRRPSPSLPSSPTPRCLRGWPWGCPRSCPLSSLHEDLMRAALLDQEEPLEVDSEDVAPDLPLPEVAGEVLQDVEAPDGEHDQDPGHPSPEYFTLEEVPHAGVVAEPQEETVPGPGGLVHDQDKAEPDQGLSHGE